MDARSAKETSSKRPAWTGDVDERATASAVASSRSGSRRDGPWRATFVVSRHTYRVCWWVTFALHTFVGVFVLFVGLSHLALSIPVIHSSTIALGISIPLKRVSGASYVVVALLHFQSVGRMVSRSIRARRLALIESSKKSSSNPKMAGRIRRTYRRMVAFWSRCLGPESAIGFHGRYFAGVHVTREGTEVVMQTYQAFVMSHSIAKVWINQFAVATVVLNCWSTLFVNFAGARHSLTARRLLHLVSDMYLDFVFGIVLPVCVMVPYAIAFDWTNGSYPRALIDDDVWLANAVAEARQVLVTSYVDYVASLLPHVGIYNCLTLIKTLIRVQKPRSSTSPSMATIVPISTFNDAPRPKVVDAAERESRLVRVTTFCMAVWGAVVLGIHIDAQLRSASMASAVEAHGCLLFQRPWLVSKIPCSLLRLNCYRRNTSGSSVELDVMLSKFYRPVLSWITFAHCTALEIPETLTDLHELSVIDVYNSTLVEWSLAAGISHAKHPSMVKVTFTHSRLPTFPQGLLHNNLPRAMNAVGFYFCNVSELPAELGDVWASSAIDVFGLEGSSVRRLPATFGRIRWRILWLANNQIDELPGDLLANSSLERLWVSGNPLTTLPNAIGSTAHLFEVYAEDTNISSIPRWMEAWLGSSKLSGVGRIASFYGSPVCHEGSLAFNLSLCKDNRQTTHGVISQDPSTMTNAKYPL